MNLRFDRGEQIIGLGLEELAGGRTVIVETNWRSLVLNNAAPELTETMIAAWDRAVANPNPPARLGSVLRARGFTAGRVLVRFQD